jgi:hypothetical protein
MTGQAKIIIGTEHKNIVTIADNPGLLATAHEPGTPE